MPSSKPQKPYALLSRTAKYYRDSKKGRDKHRETSNRISLRPAEKARKAQRDKFNNDNKKSGTYKEGLDASHTKSGFLKYKDSSENRGAKITSGDLRARSKKK
jgi:hypothetical protein|tara:strand:- start:763 stop:1071 length:309 start_codon:yes stop_codon:yes gene_type:complete